jgi:transcriptional regulator with XRE-family HTH domain
MTRRHEHDAQYQRWLVDVGRRIAGVRARHGWTQVEAAEHCSIDVKQFQDIERGRRPISTHTLFVISMGLGVTPATLVPSPDVQQGMAALEVVGWQPARGRNHHGVRVYDLGKAREGESALSSANLLGHAVAPKGRRLRTEGLFIAQVHGGATSPHVPNGAWCLFRETVSPPLLAKVVLMRSPQGNGFELMRIGSLNLREGGAIEVQLDSLTYAGKSTQLRASSEADLAAVGELMEVL